MKVPGVGDWEACSIQRIEPGIRLGVRTDSGLSSAALLRLFIHLERFENLRKLHHGIPCPFSALIEPIQMGDEIAT